MLKVSILNYLRNEYVFMTLTFLIAVLVGLIIGAMVIHSLILGVLASGFLLLDFWLIWLIFVKKNKDVKPLNP